MGSKQEVCDAFLKTLRLTLFGFDVCGLTYREAQASLKEFVYIRFENGALKIVDVTDKGDSGMIVAIVEALS